MLGAIEVRIHPNAPAGTKIDHYSLWKPTVKVKRLFAPHSWSLTDQEFLDRAKGYAAGIRAAFPEKWFDFHHPNYDEKIDSLVYDFKSFDPVLSALYGGPSERLASLLDSFCEWANLKGFDVRFADREPADQVTPSTTNHRPSPRP